MPYKIVPSFEFALRRTLFLLIVLTAYLAFGSIVLRILPKPQDTKVSEGKQARLDFERAELLNVLWAESIGRSEHDWALLANQKLDSYERSVLESGGSVQAGHLQSLPSAFHYCFSLITTIGGIDVDELSFEAKMFSMIYTAIGIPLVMMYLAQCAKAITSILSGQSLFIFGVGLLFFTAILYDIFEALDEDTPFSDALFSVFLTMSTIGVAEKDTEVPPLVLYVSAIVSLSAFSVAFLTIQRAIEKRIGNYELLFSRKFAQIERVLSGDRLDTLDEDEKCDDSEYTSG